MLANCLLDTGDTYRAMEMLAAAKAIHATHKEIGEHFKRPLRELQARSTRHHA
jgi:hypothetical protein